LTNYVWGGERGPQKKNQHCPRDVEKPTFETAVEPSSTGDPITHNAEQGKEERKPKEKRGISNHLTKPNTNKKVYSSRALGTIA